MGVHYTILSTFACSFLKKNSPGEKYLNYLLFNLETKMVSINLRCPWSLSEMPRTTNVEGVLLLICSSWIPLLNFMKQGSRLNRGSWGLKIWEILSFTSCFYLYSKIMRATVNGEMLLMLRQILLFCRTTTHSLWTVSSKATVVGH